MRLFGKRLFVGLAILVPIAVILNFLGIYLMKIGYGDEFIMFTAISMALSIALRIEDKIYPHQCNTEGK
ncbi:hypothetical protein TRIP_C20928 [Candidatus Zixiibacteriota bacterium]|nr:hypothetical protein TRIP_C20928 [candidate division Zixibacteria bacterium]